MNVKTDHSGGVAIVRVGETRLMYPILSDFSTAVSGLVAAGQADPGEPLASAAPTEAACGSVKVTRGTAS